MKKFISIFVCLMIVLALGCGCAQSSDKTNSEGGSRTSDFESSRASVENILIDAFGAENLKFDYDKSNDSYLVIIYVDFSYSTFYSDSSCADLMDNINTMSRSSQTVLGCDCLYMVYSRTDGVIYGSENGRDVTRALLSIEAGN